MLYPIRCNVLIACTYWDCSTWLNMVKSSLSRLLQPEFYVIFAGRPIICPSCSLGSHPLQNLPVGGVDAVALLVEFGSSGGWAALATTSGDFKSGVASPLVGPEKSSGLGGLDVAKGSTVPVFVWALPSEAAPIYDNLTFVQMRLSGGRSLVSHYIAQPLLWVGAHNNYFVLELLLIWAM